jgi:hypothetical protein
VNGLLTNIGILNVAMLFIEMVQPKDNKTCSISVKQFNRKKIKSNDKKYSLGFEPWSTVFKDMPRVDRGFGVFYGHLVYFMAIWYIL